MQEAALQERFWPYVFLALSSGGTAAVLSALDRPYWLIFLAVFFIVIIFALIRVALHDPVDEPASELVAQHPPGALPAGFGRALLDQMPLALVVISPVGRITYGNKAAKRQFPHAKKGDHFATLLRTPAFVDAVNDVIANGGKRKVAFSAGQETKHYYEARIGVLPAGSEFGAAEQILVDIEDRTLEHRSDKMRSDFIANASHELRTPLASILGYIETLQGHARDDLKAREKFLKIMHKQASRMQRLVDDLMSLSRIELNAHVRPSTPCNIFDLVREAVAGLKPLEAENHVVLDCRLPENGPVIPGDRDQLNQVFINLLVNAMKYGNKGETVEIELAPETPERAGMVGITVRDHGPGIAPKHIERLTERFYRVNAAQSRNKGGTGLGLAIVKHILQRHRGQLQIESVEGRGSEFTVWLPATA